MLTERRLTKTGLTLVEVMIGASITLMFLAVLAFTYRGTIKSLRHRMTLLDLQDRCVVAMEKLTRDLQSSSASGVSVFSSGPTSTALAIQKSDELNSVGRLEWEQKLIVYWYDADEKSLFRRVVNQSEASAAGVELSQKFAQRIDDVALTQLINTATTPVPQLREVHDFSVTTDWLTDTSKPLLLSVTVKNPDEKETDKTFRLTHGVHFYLD